MKHYLLTFAMLCSIVCIGQIPTSDDFTRIIVKFKSDFNSRSLQKDVTSFGHPKLDKINTRNGLKKAHALNTTSSNDLYVLELAHHHDLKTLLYEYYETDLFEYVEPDYEGQGGGGLVPNDHRYFKQWGLNNDGTFLEGGAVLPGADIDMQRAWEITTGNEDCVIAVLDSGLKLDHPEFQNRLWTKQAITTGIDYANGDNDATDDHGHGTNVTSILAATGNNGNAFAGVNWKAKIMPLKILDENNRGFYSWWIEAIYFAADNGAKVLNMSVGGSSYSAAMEEAIDYATEKGAIVVACMMNENNGVRYYPAAYQNTIAVGSTNPDDSRSDSFPWNTSKGSNYGSHIDISAPGNYIYGLSYSSSTNTNTYWSGTSQATPHVAGVVSLLLALDPDLTLESVRSIITSTSEDMVGRSAEDTEGWDQYHGHGRLNAAEALNALISSTEETESKIFSIQPNPITKGDQLNIQLNASTEKTVSIFDVSGRLVMMEKHEGEVFSLNTDNLQEGVYVINIRLDQEKFQSEKIIIK